jgi:hypothetical protein
MFSARQFLNETCGIPLEVCFKGGGVGKSGCAAGHARLHALAADFRASSRLASACVRFTRHNPHTHVPPPLCLPGPGWLPRAAAGAQPAPAPAAG